MELELALYFLIVFMGLQGLYRFSESVSLALLTTGNLLILVYSFTNKEWALLLLTVMMMVAQLTRVMGEDRR